MGYAQIANLMAEMKLEGMLKNLEETLNMAAQNQWSHTDMLDALVQAEYDLSPTSATGA
jgi:hypothetical protein